jgi:hypothetical protein
MLKLIQKNRTLILVILLVFCLLFFGIPKVEGMKSSIRSIPAPVPKEKKITEVDDALEKRIEEAKKTTKLDPTLELDYNRAFDEMGISNIYGGWWGDVIFGKNTPTIYLKEDRSKWIFPY